MALITTAQAGNWNVGATWNGGVVPVLDTDTATTNHAVDVTADAGIGTDGGTALTINAPFTVKAGVSLTVRGGVSCEDFATFEAGAQLLYDGTSDAVWNQQTGGIHACAKFVGVEGNPARVESTNTGKLRFYATNLAGYGRIEADWTELKDLGSDTNPTAIAYRQRGEDPAYPFYMRNCVLDGCYSIEPREGSSDDHNAGHTGKLEFYRLTINTAPTPDPLPNGNWAHLDVQGFLGMDVRIEECNFSSDARVFFNKPDDVIARHNVFAGGVTIRHAGGNVWVAGTMKEFSGNWYRFDGATGFGARYGEELQNNIFVHGDTAFNNPHFGSCDQGAGGTLIQGCVYSSVNALAAAEGDGPFSMAATSGGQADNHLRLVNNICLPTAAGYGNDCTSATIFSMIDVAANVSVSALHCTANIGRLSSGTLGETQNTTAGQLAAFKGNITVGRGAVSCYKISNHGNTVIDTFDPGDASNNAGYGLAAGTESPGGGYDDFTFTGGGPHNVGVDDVDDVDPDYVDTARQPWTWVDPTHTPLQGIAAAEARLMDRSSGYTIHDALAYIRNGWRPRAEQYRGAGPASEGSRDLGAVPMAEALPAALSIYDVPVSEFPSSAVPDSVDEFLGRVEADLGVTPNLIEPKFGWVGAAGSGSMRLNFDAALSLAEQAIVLGLAGDAPA